MLLKINLCRYDIYAASLLFIVVFGKARDLYNFIKMCFLELRQNGSILSIVVFMSSGLILFRSDIVMSGCNLDGIVCNVFVFYFSFVQLQHLWLFLCLY